MPPGRPTRSRHVAHYMLTEARTMPDRSGTIYAIRNLYAKPNPASNMLIANSGPDCGVILTRCLDLGYWHEICYSRALPSTC
jgi:hypothetical protein